jgi:kanamycin kinase
MDLDQCLPNVPIDGDDVVGYVDLGELGVADRWWDLAVASWSVTWNLGPGLEAHFLDTYGVAPDVERSRFYRLLYDVVS